MSPLLIRDERTDDAQAISRLVDAAFAAAPRRSGREASIVASLRDDRALTVSLVAQVDEACRGYVAASSVRIGGQATRWHGLGPVAVAPGWQRMAIGSALVTACLLRLREHGSDGCVVLGAPGFYGRFGFGVVPGLRYGEVPTENFMALPFHSHCPLGVVEYHPAFVAA